MKTVAITLIGYYANLFHFLSALFFNKNMAKVTDGISGANRFFFLIAAFVFLHFCISFMMILTCCYWQLAALNVLIEKCYQKDFGMTEDKFVKKITQMYDKICDVIDAVSAYYLITVLIFICAFNMLNTFFFSLIYINFQNPSSETFYLFLTSVNIFLYYAPCILWTMMFAGWIQAEGKRTVSLVQKLANRRMSVKVLKIHSAFSLLVAHRTPRISCGLFDLNWKTSFAMMGSIFSFTVIIIQFYDVSFS